MRCRIPINVGFSLNRLLEFYRDNGKENGNYYNIGGYRGYIGIMVNEMEATVGIQTVILRHAHLSAWCLKALGRLVGNGSFPK